MPAHDVIVVGASAGGVQALTQLVNQFPAEFPAAVFVALHVAPFSTSRMPEILSRNGRMPAAHAVDGEPLVPGRIYIAPPDHHLLVERDGLRLSLGPRENGHRPAIDPLFRSAAEAFGARVTGVILSGSLDDGTAGLASVKAHGGVALVQDPSEALHPGMPRSAIDHVQVDYRLGVAEIGRKLVELASNHMITEARPASSGGSEETRIASFDMETIEKPNHGASPSGYGCPDCGGSLWEYHDGELIRFRCRVGHAWSAASLMSRQSEAIEQALWVALRALEERASLAERMAERHRRQGRERSAEYFADQEATLRARAELIRNVLVQGGISSESGPSRNGGFEDE